MADAVVADAEKAKKSKKPLMIAVAVVLAAALGGGAFVTLGAKPSAAAGKTTTTIALGPIVRLAPTTLNLSDGHYLQIALALQLVAKPKNVTLALAVAPSTDGAKTNPTSPLGGEESKALDQAIGDLGDMTFDQLTSPAGRVKAKSVLSAGITKAYGGDVTTVYFTDFVMS